MSAASMSRRQRRAFKRQWDSQIEQERNGAPIPPEIAARMTRPAEPQQLYQVVVTKVADRLPLRVGPMMTQDACGAIAEAINKQVALGRERTWADAVVVPCMQLDQFPKLLAA